LVAAVARDLATHFNLEGELQLESAPPLDVTRPQRRGLGSGRPRVSAVPSSSMLVRCRIIADGKVVSSTTDAALVLRASLWRDVWAARQPLTVGHHV
jgi:flagella basal body P-ring formation protein FlgA